MWTKINSFSGLIGFLLRAQFKVRLKNYGKFFYITQVMITILSRYVKDLQVIKM